MAFGNQVAEFKAKSTSRVLREIGPGRVVVEINNEATLSGKLNGMLVYTATVTQHPDGTGVAETKIAVMGPEGEMASGTGRALGVMAQGKVTIRGIVALHSDNPKWNWLNTTPLALESVADMKAGEEVGRIYEWK